MLLRLSYLSISYGSYLLCITWMMILGRRREDAGHRLSRVASESRERMTDDQEYWSVRRPSVHAAFFLVSPPFYLHYLSYYHISFWKAELMSLLGFLEPLLIWLDS